MKIIIDAMGGDNAPDEIVKGALDASRELGVDIVLCGRGEDVLRSIERMGLSDIPQGIEIVNATEVIGMEDDPSNAVRVKKDSSLAVALNLLRDGRGDALVSAGNTGAILSGATLIVKRVRGIRRAALALLLPSPTGGFVLIDTGANTECTSEYLLQFAFMGSYYAQHVLKLKSPRVGLLNNGAEPTKGMQLQLDTYKLLEEACAESYINFVGNIEARDVMNGVCDVLVCDGFTGNIFLKSLEGTASFIMTELKKIYKKSLITKLSAILIKKHVYSLREKMNSDTIGGTIMLGISKPVIKAHGSSKAIAITNAIRQAVDAVLADTASQLQENISRMKINTSNA